MRSLAGRLTWLQQLAVGGAIVLFGASAYLLASRALTSDRRSFVGETARRLAATFDEDLADESDTLEVARGLLEDGAEVGVWVEVAAHDGRVLASSIPHRDVEDGRAEHVASAANPGGIRVTAAMSDAPERRVLATLARSLAVAALPILVLTLVVGRAVARRGLRPLSIMATRAADVPIEDGVRSLGARTGVEEVDRLAESFDRLLERLDDARARERRFAADASHELRTPLNVLGGEIELLRERAAPGSRDAEPLSRASTQVAELRDLVEALLLLSRAREDAGGAHADFEVVNLCDVAREAAADALHARGLRRGDLRVAEPRRQRAQVHVAGPARRADPRDGGARDDARRRRRRSGRARGRARADLRCVLPRARGARRTRRLRARPADSAARRARPRRRRRSVRLGARRRAVRAAPPGASRLNDRGRPGRVGGLDCRRTRR